VLQQLPGFSHPDLLVGGETFDDAGVYRLDSNRALVLTVDVLTPVADDPYVFGQIAAANSLSDVYAMGGTPLAALCVLGYPVGEVGHETVRRVLAGAWDKVREAGAVVVGGHTTKDMELRCGLSVTGIVHPDRVLTNAGARPGDALILTKPLGSGVITTALRAGLAGSESVRQANATMVELNRAAAEAATELGVSAATDVTGFGLLGHAWEMAQASRVDIHVEAGRVPFIAGAAELAAQHLFPQGSLKNRTFMETRAAFDDGVAEDARCLLCDAQTSGGLLLSVVADRAAGLVNRLREQGVASATVIGCVVPGRGSVRVYQTMDSCAATAAC
jgi:selenide,water dikinase